MSKKQKIAENLKLLEEFNDDSSNSDAVDETVGEIVDVNFEGFTAEEDDFHGIQRLLGQTFRGLEDVKLADVADTIIAQNYVGCVIKEVIDDEKQAMEVDADALEGTPDEQGDYVFAVNTVLNISQNKKSPSWTKSLRSTLEQRCSSSDAPEATKHLFSSLLAGDKEQVGLLINERLVNLPAEVAMPAFRTLQSEIEEAKQIQLPFNFKYIILICKTYKISTLKSKKKSRQGKKEEAPAAEKATKTVKEVWANSEEEVISQFAAGSFEYSVQDCNSFTAESWSSQEVNNSKRVRPHRRVLVITPAKMAEALDSVAAQMTT